MKNANDELREHSSTDNYYKYICGMVITDGCKSLCEQFSCWWFADVIASYYPKLRAEEFQVWTLTKHIDGSATVKCTDGNDRVLQTQTIPWTDFDADVCTVWCEGNVMLLPSEH